MNSGVSSMNLQKWAQIKSKNMLYKMPNHWVTVLVYNLNNTYQLVAPWVQHLVRDFSGIRPPLNALSYSYMTFTKRRHGVSTSLSDSTCVEVMIVLVIYTLSISFHSTLLFIHNCEDLFHLYCYLLFYNFRACLVNYTLCLFILLPFLIFIYLKYMYNVVTLILAIKDYNL